MPTTESWHMLYDTTNVAPDKSCLRCSNYKLDFCIGPTQSKAHKLLHTCTNTQHTYTRAHTHTCTHQHTCIHTQREMIHTICMYTCTHVQYTSQQVHMLVLLHTYIWSLAGCIHTVYWQSCCGPAHWACTWGRRRTSGAGRTCCQCPSAPSQTSADISPSTPSLPHLRRQQQRGWWKWSARGDTGEKPYLQYVGDRWCLRNQVQGYCVGWWVRQENI